MRADLDPLSPSPDQRTRAIAAVLARGLRARRDRLATSHESATASAETISPESRANCLEVPSQLRLSVLHG